MQKIIPFLWYDDKAEEAAKLYVSLFNNSRVVGVSKGSIRSVSLSAGGGQQPWKLLQDKDAHAS